MEKEFQYLVNLATEYERLASEDNALFETINNLPNEDVKIVYEKYINSAFHLNQFNN